MLEKVGFTRKVLVKGAFGNTCAGNDSIDAGAFEAMRGKLANGRSFDDGAFGFG